MVPLDTVEVRLYNPFMRRAFEIGSSRSTSTTDGGGYDSSSASAHAFATSTSCTSATSRGSIELQDADVVGGRSPMSHAHPGNRLYTSLVSANSRQYQGTSKREEKSRITNEVISQIEGNGGRFLGGQSGAYFEMDRKGIHEKVSHALRSRKEPVSVRIRRPRRRTERQPPSGEEQNAFDQLLITQRSIYEDLLRERDAAGAFSDDEGDKEDDDEDDDEETFLL